MRAIVISNCNKKKHSFLVFKWFTNKDVFSSKRYKKMIDWLKALQTIVLKISYDYFEFHKCRSIVTDARKRIESNSTQKKWFHYLVDSPTMLLFLLQNAKSFLKARKSNNKWIAETPKVTSKRKRFVSANIPLTSSESFGVNPRL